MKPEQIAHVVWHAWPAAEVVAALETGTRGLSDDEAARRREAFGANVLPRPKRRSPVVVYLAQFKSPLIYLLFAAAAVSLAIGELTDALFIFAVLQINAVIGTVQEWRAETSAEALQGLIRNEVVVVRDGLRREVESVELVPGDIVRLESGSLVPADIRLLAAHDLKLDESLLTGESLPVGKDPDAVLDEQTPVGDRQTMIHAGSTVLNGRADGVVAQTGMHTEVGRIAQALATTGTAPPPIVIRLERFTRAVGFMVVVAVAALGVALYAKGMPPAEIFFVAVALAVSAIPEGLPVAITVALSVGSVRMARRHVVVRRLPAVEGLGACTVIASDKTGTLTCNELTIGRLWLPGIGDVTVEGRGYAPEGAVTREGGPLDAAGVDVLRRLAVAGALANEATLRYARDGTLHHFGDTVDVAFLALAGKAGLERGELLERFPEIGAVPYESARQYAAAFNRDGERLFAHVKGAAERVLPMCDGVDREAVLAEAERLAAEGFRVLAVAAGRIARPITPERADVALGDLDFLGLAGLIDPLRPEVPDAVERCRKAGVEVRMVTGDHPVTALAIARQLGLADDPEHAIHGNELQNLSNDPAELDLAVAQAVVYARVEPVQKLTIVQSLQRSGHFVAVTGDGVNDAPALHAANIGVAMGLSGTDVARGAADLILTDDNFASIANGIEEGRVAYDNVRKVIYLLVSTGASEIILFFLAFAFDLPLPLFAAQLLWLNLVTNGIQHVALAFEKGEPGVLDQPPRPPKQPIFDRRMIEEVLVSGAFIGIVGFLFFHWALGRGWSEFEARNGMLLLMVCFENAHVFNCRSEWRSAFRVPFRANRFLFAAVAAAQGVHIGAMYVPGLSDILRIEPVSLQTWLPVAGLALGLIAAMEIFKLLRPRPQRRA
jgi:magnesium-transporting ATPase (P-type)